MIRQRYFEEWELERLLGHSSTCLAATLLGVDLLIHDRKFLAVNGEEVADSVYFSLRQVVLRLLGKGSVNQHSTCDLPVLSRRMRCVLQSCPGILGRYIYYDRSRMRTCYLVSVRDWDGFFTVKRHLRLLASLDSALKNMEV